MAMNGLVMSLSVKPKALSSARCGARSTPFFISSLLMRLVPLVSVIVRVYGVVGFKLFLLLGLLCDFLSIPPSYIGSTGAWTGVG